MGRGRRRGCGGVESYFSVASPQRIVEACRGVAVPVDIVPVGRGGTGRISQRAPRGWLPAWGLVLHRSRERERERDSSGLLNVYSVLLEREGTREEQSLIPRLLPRDSPAARCCSA